MAVLSKLLLLNISYIEPLKVKTSDASMFVYKMEEAEKMIKEKPEEKIDSQK